MFLWWWQSRVPLKRMTVRSRTNGPSHLPPLLCNLCRSFCRQEKRNFPTCRQSLLLSLIASWSMFAWREEVTVAVTRWIGRPFFDFLRDNFWFANTVTAIWVRHLSSHFRFCTLWYHHTRTTNQINGAFLFKHLQRWVILGSFTIYRVEYFLCSFQDSRRFVVNLLRIWWVTNFSGRLLMWNGKFARDSLNPRLG